MFYKMEVCVDSVESAVNAEQGGASRVELCANLVEGGTTPSVGTLEVMKRHVTIPAYVMIRPRGGDFLYTNAEYDVMKADLRHVKAAGADGIVLGILNSDGTVDENRCRELIELARPLPVTFHRAIDMTPDLPQALEAVISLGCERVLTSGGESSALEGAPAIADLVKQAGDRIIIVPGGGINERNLNRILESTGCREFHGSARCAVPTGMSYRKSHVTMGAAFGPPEFGKKVSDVSKVKAFVNIAMNSAGGLGS